MSRKKIIAGMLIAALLLLTVPLVSPTSVAQTPEITISAYHKGYTGYAGSTVVYAGSTGYGGITNFTTMASSVGSRSFQWGRYSFENISSNSGTY
ncbi:MAG: hypothetical protein ACYC9S_12330, partial [Leptospirales bacterium]